MAYFAEQRRHERYDEILVSPHMDDAAYSSGGRIAQLRRAGKNVLVITVFGNGALHADAPAPDAKNRFEDYAARAQEDRAAMSVLDVDYIWLNMPELLYRKTSPRDIARFAFPFWPLPSSAAHEGLFEAVRGIVAAHLAPGGVVTFPLAVGAHPDHRIAYEVGVRLRAAGQANVEFYEDLPYARCSILRRVRVDELDGARPLGALAGGLALNHFLFGKFRLLRYFTLLPILGYALALLLVAALTRARRARTSGDLHVEDVRIDDVIDDKVAAMRCYPTQTALFFTMDDAIFPMLAEQGRYLERRWRAR